MIVKPNLSPIRIAQYTRGPMLWAAAWAVAIPSVHAVTGWSWLQLPFAPVGAMVAALAIFVAFRNNAAFGRWNEARAAWQTMLVCCRVLARQVVASADSAVASGAVDRETAQSFVEPLVRRLIAIAHAAAAPVRGPETWAVVERSVSAQEAAGARASADPVNRLLLDEGRQLKAAIRAGVLGQFDPIAMEPQLAALNTAAGAMERIRTTPTPRQYDYFTRRFIELLAVVLPMGTLSLLPESPVLAGAMALLLSGMFIIMAVTGAANDEPFSGLVTDVPVSALAREVERDLLDLLPDADLPPPLEPVDGYLW
jgi:ion channel-forming bestrophin family protein